MIRAKSAIFFLFLSTTTSLGHEAHWKHGILFDIEDGARMEIGCELPTLDERGEKYTDCSIRITYVKPGLADESDDIDKKISEFRDNPNSLLDRCKDTMDSISRKRKRSDMAELENGLLTLKQKYPFKQRTLEMDNALRKHWRALEKFCNRPNENNLKRALMAGALKDRISCELKVFTDIRRFKVVERWSGFTDRLAEINPDWRFIRFPLLVRKEDRMSIEGTYEGNYIEVIETTPRTPNTWHFDRYVSAFVPRLKPDQTPEQRWEELRPTIRSQHSIEPMPVHCAEIRPF